MKDKLVSMKVCGTTNPFKKEASQFSSDCDELRLYVKKVNSARQLEAQEEKELAQKAKTGDLKARQELVSSNLKLVLTIARKAIHVSRLPLIDLIQEGNLGLMVAVEKFNPNLGYRFSTYAS